MTPELGEAEEGFTLVELLVASSILFLLLGIVLTSMVSSQRITRDVKTDVGVNEEARTALDRISRELRQARDITAVIGSPGSVAAGKNDGQYGLTFEADFNGNTAIDTNAADPEVITYTYDGSRILLSASDTSGHVVTSPVLSGKVSSFRFDYRSSNYKYDCNGDGVTDWTEIDNAACRPPALAGDQVGVLDANELRFVNSVLVTFTVQEGSKVQSYRTQIDLRNAQH